MVVVIKKDLLVSKEPAAYLPEDGKLDGGDEAYCRKTARIEDIRLNHGDKRDWRCVGGGQARHGGRRIRADASRRDAPRRVEEASGGGTPPSRFQGRADDPKRSRAMGSGSVNRGSLLRGRAKA